MTLLVLCVLIILHERSMEITRGRCVKVISLNSCGMFLGLSHSLKMAAFMIWQPPVWYFQFLNCHRSWFIKVTLFGLEIHTLVHFHRLSFTKTEPLSVNYLITVECTPEGTVELCWEVVRSKAKSVIEQSRWFILTLQKSKYLSFVVFLTMTLFHSPSSSLVLWLKITIKKQ